MGKIDNYKAMIQNIYKNDILNSGYGYFSSLGNKKDTDVHHKIYSSVNSRLQQIQESDKALTSFTIIAQKLETFSASEAKKEEMFLRTLPGFEDATINYSDPASAREILINLNKILGTEKEIERVTTLVKNNSKTARDVTKYAVRYLNKEKQSGGYIQTALKDNKKALLNSNFYQAIIDFIANKGSFDKIEQEYRKWFVKSVSKGVTKMLKAGVEKKETDPQKQTYSELLKELEKNKGKLKGHFAEQCAEAIGLNTLIENLKEYVNNFKDNGDNFDIANIEN